MTSLSWVGDLSIPGNSISASRMISVRSPYTSPATSSPTPSLPRHTCSPSTTCSIGQRWVYDRLNELVNMEPGFYSVMKFFELMYELSISSDYKLLSSSAFAHVSMAADSRRVQKVKEYIDSHYREEIRLQTLAALVSMTSTAFSRFFKLRTNKSISEYIIDIRLGHAARLLADSTMAVVEICYHCGFNNISNFNRIFKKRKGCTPTEFRENYHKKHVIV